jgi:hypothetical protein
MLHEAFTSEFEKKKMKKRMMTKRAKLKEFPRTPSSNEKPRTVFFAPLARKEGVVGYFFCFCRFYGFLTFPY